MRLSSSPLAEAVVVAPILKLWPLKREESSPASFRAFRTSLTNWALVKNCPLLYTNRVPGAFPLATIYLRRAATGQSGLWLVLPRTIDTLFLSWSVLDCFRCMKTIEGVRASSTEIMETEIYIAVKFVNSLRRKFSDPQESKKCQASCCCPEHLCIT